jgi:hypothetical protein
MTIYSNWRPLSAYRITQDEYGATHLRLTYGGVLQHPLDFGDQVVGYPITLDMDCKVIYQEARYGNYVTVNPIGTPYHFCFVHTNCHSWPRGTVIHAGEPICRIAPSSQNGGYIPHLHACAMLWYGKYSPAWIRNVVFAQVGKDLHKGMNVKFSRATNVRTGNGLKYPVQAVAKAGAVGYIKDGPRSGDGYRWFDCQFSSGTGWCIDNFMIPTNEPITPV